MSAGKVDLLAVRALLAEATPGEWDVESFRSDAGHTAYEITDARGESILDTLNSDLACIHPPEDDDSREWDMTGYWNTRAVVACVNFMRQHGGAVAELIEAAKGGRPGNPGCIVFDHEQAARLTAALARVQP